MSLMIRDCMRPIERWRNILISFSEECDNFTGIIEKKFMREYAIVSEISEVLKLHLDIELRPFIAAIFTLIMHMYHRSKDINKRIGHHSGTWLCDCLLHSECSKSDAGSVCV